MLHEFVTENRAEIIVRCRSLICASSAPRATPEELEHGVPLFLDQLVEALQHQPGENAEIAASAVVHATELRARGFTIAQVVRDYGSICQSITELAVDCRTPIAAQEFQTLNLSLDQAIAGAVTEYARLRENEGKERLGSMAHELRNALNSAFLAFGMLKSGRVAIGGSTGALLERSLRMLKDLVDRELAEVRLGAGINHPETIELRNFLEEVEVGAVMAAETRGVKFALYSGARDLCVLADRQLLASIVANLLQNAFKFTERRSEVTLNVRATAERVFIDIEDECGGLPAGLAERLFEPHAQKGPDRSGLGLGLAIARRGAEAIGGKVTALDKPGKGCVFTIELQRGYATSPTH